MPQQIRGLTLKSTARQGKNTVLILGCDLINLQMQIEVKHSNLY